MKLLADFPLQIKVLSKIKISVVCVNMRGQSVKEVEFLPSLGVFSNVTHRR